MVTKITRTNDNISPNDKQTPSFSSNMIDHLSSSILSCSLIFTLVDTGIGLNYEAVP